MRYFRLIVLSCVLSLASCGQKFLDVKPDQHQRVPSRIADYLAMMDNASYPIDPMNFKSSHLLGIIGADEFYIDVPQLEAFPSGKYYDWQRNAYQWAREIYIGGEGDINNPIDYSSGYNRILKCNIVLEGLSNIVPKAEDMDDWNHAKGAAHFFRAFNYYSLAQLYSPVYGVNSSSSKFGLPLRKTSDVTVTVNRSSVAQTYDFIIADLAKAEVLLPTLPSNNFRPSKAAVYGLFARLYLQIGDYSKSARFAGLCLAINSNLSDFNTLSFSDGYTFQPEGEGNPEIIFLSAAHNTPSMLFGESRFNPDKELMDSYGPGDFRKAAYFLDEGESVRYRGSYMGSDLYFTGLATDEMYLIRAECNARMDNLEEALQDLNYLRSFRIDGSSFTELMSSDKQQVLDWVIQERRKELVLRGTRWEDLRRLNKESRYAKTLERTISEGEVKLLPNSARYTWPLPIEAIQYGGYTQNPR